MPGTLADQRITVEEVRSAFRDTGMTATTANWVNHDQTEACGLGAVYVASGAEMPDGLIFRQWVAKRLRLSLSYVEGFTKGWDNEPPDSKGEHYLRGYADGREAAVAMGLTVSPEED